MTFNGVGGKTIYRIWQIASQFLELLLERLFLALLFPEHVFCFFERSFGDLVVGVLALAVVLPANLPQNNTDQQLSSSQ